MTGNGYSDREKHVIHLMAGQLREAVLLAQKAGKEPDWAAITGLICALWDFRNATPEDMRQVIQDLEKEAQKIKKRRMEEEATLNRLLRDLKEGRA